jgi:CRP/FNR family transcriptional regulator, cyclic AMP receptor protein
MRNHGRKHREHRRELALEPEVFLKKTGMHRTVTVLMEGQTIFCPDAVFYVQKGKVKLVVTFKGGKEATVALFGAGSFVGEESITGTQLQRLATATALTRATILRRTTNWLRRASGNKRRATFNVLKRFSNR